MHNPQMNKLLIPFCVLLSLVACAITPLPDEHYEKAAMQFMGVHKCGVKGLMPVEVAARGKQRIQNHVNSYTYDKSRLDIFINSADVTLTVTPEICNTLAMQIPGGSGGYAPAQSTPRTTNCSTYFGQTHCTTF